VNDRQHPTGPPDTASLLAAAEQQRQLHGSSLVACLLDEVSVSLSAAFVNVWEIAESNEPRLLWKRGNSESVPERVKQAVFGQVKQVSTIPVSSESPHTAVYATLCEVGEGLRIVLELAVPDHYFDRQQILELVELLADLHRRGMISVLLRNSRRAGELQQIVALLHSDLDPVRVATSLASDAAEFLKCHRISVARRISRSRWELVTATAVIQPDPRSDSSRRLCGLIEDACQRGMSLVAESTSPDYSVRPLSTSGQWDDAEWAALFEWPADSDKDRRTDPYLIEICRHAALAFRNCQDYSNAGLLSTVRRLPQTLRSRRILIALGLVTALTAGLLLFKIDLQIEVMGKLVPSERVFIFAPEDGVITDVFVEDGASVAVNGQLCTLRNEDLEIQLEGIDGEVASTQARLAALDSLRGDRSLSPSGMLSVEQAELKERLIALEAQSVILNRRISKLAMDATMAGRIYGDRLQELLKGRPVQRGQYLFELANPDAGWQLDLRIPEVDVRHVIQQQATSGTELVVSFAVETAPEKEFTTTLTRLSASTDIDEYGRLSVLATATPGHADILNPRPGAGVVGHIHCGSRAAGYVLFRRIIESFQRRWWK
jgi:hypothetical protein